jgi:hypothetical protein
MATAKAKKVWKSIARAELEQWVREGRAPVHELSMRAFKPDPATQARVSMDRAHVKSLCGIIDLAESNGQDPSKALAPIVVFRDRKTGEYHTADGFHRYEVHKAKGLPSIRAHVIESDEAEREALLYCVSANLELSLYPTADDKRKAILMLLKDEKYFCFPMNKIAERCGVNKATVRKVMREYCISNKITFPVWVSDPDTGRTMHAPRAHAKLREDGVVPTYEVHSMSKKYNDSKAYLVHKGRRRFLGVDSPDVRRAFQDEKRKIVSQIDPTSPDFLAVGGNLVAWLNAMGITASVYLCNLFYTKRGVVLHGAIVVTSSSIRDFSKFCQIVGELRLIATLIDPSYRRIIVAKYDGIDPRIVDLAKRDGIEFLTPAEIVAEFGPKPTDGEPTVAGPDDGNTDTEDES